LLGLSKNINNEKNRLFLETISKLPKGLKHVQHPLLKRDHILLNLVTR